MSLKIGTQCESIILNLYIRILIWIERIFQNLINQGNNRLFCQDWVYEVMKNWNLYKTWGKKCGDNITNYTKEHKTRLQCYVADRNKNSFHLSVFYNVMSNFMELQNRWALINFESKLHIFREYNDF